MRIAVCDLSVGDLDILDLDKEAEDLFYEYDDAIDFFTALGYAQNYISWMVIDGRIVERKVRNSNGSLIVT
jgi:hypothetical protein